MDAKITLCGLGNLRSDRLRAEPDLAVHQGAQHPGVLDPFRGATGEVGVQDGEIGKKTRRDPPEAIVLEAGIRMRGRVRGQRFLHGDALFRHPATGIRAIDGSPEHGGRDARQGSIGATGKQAGHEQAYYWYVAAICAVALLTPLLMREPRRDSMTG